MIYYPKIEPLFAFNEETKKPDLTQIRNPIFELIKERLNNLVESMQNLIKLLISIKQLKYTCIKERD